MSLTQTTHPHPPAPNRTIDWNLAYLACELGGTAHSWPSSTVAPSPGIGWISLGGQASTTCVGVAVFLFNPLDCLRIRWQVQTQYPSMATHLKGVLRNEGLLRGNLLLLLNI